MLTGLLHCSNWAICVDQAVSRSSARSTVFIAALAAATAATEALQRAPPSPGGRTPSKPRRRISVVRDCAIFRNNFKLICPVQSRPQKYSTSPAPKSPLQTAPSRTQKRGVSRSSRTLDAGCGGRDSHDDECGSSVRRSRVVLTPRCWRQALKKLTLLGGDGDKKAGRRGDHVISRKPIAQGRPDALR